MECFPEDFVLLFTSHLLFFLLTLFYVELRFFFFSFLLKSSLLVLLYSIAIGREGGVGPLLALARSEIEVSCFPLFESFVYDLVFNFFIIYTCSILLKFFFIFHFFGKDVHETAAGALWNLAFYSGNALHIVEEGGVPVLVNLCSSSGSKMARFMSALALAYMFDGR